MRYMIRRGDNKLEAEVVAFVLMVVVQYLIVVLGLSFLWEDGEAWIRLSSRYT